MANEVTHRPDPDTGHLIQIVSPERLRAILDADGDDYERPEHFGYDDEWDVGGDAAPSKPEGGSDG